MPSLIDDLGTASLLRVAKMTKDIGQLLDDCRMHLSSI